MRYTLELLNETVQRDSATLIGEYTKLNDSIKVRFICSCGLEHKKTCKTLLYGEVGFKCLECTNRIRYETVKKVSMENYGVENVFQHPDIIKKARETNKKLYGVDHAIQNKDIMNRSIKTKMERYGDPYNLTSEEFVEKRRNTLIEKLGVEHPALSEEVMTKIINTNIKKYGVKFTTQSPEVFEKMKKSSFRKKSYTLPSGKEIEYQGYENLAFDILFKDIGYNEDLIITDNNLIPIFNYKLNKEDIDRKYFTDIFIPSERRCIEVKSVWTYLSEYEKNYKKHESVESQGYAIEFWIFIKNKERVVLKSLAEHIEYFNEHNKINDI